jgi:CO dehydrogenase/acetyl-CoA synthase delta subunit
MRFQAASHLFRPLADEVVERLMRSDDVVISPGTIACAYAMQYGHHAVMLKFVARSLEHERL